MSWTPADRMACVQRMKWASSGTLSAAGRSIIVERDLEGYEATLTEALTVIRGLLDAQPRHGRATWQVEPDVCECDWCYEWDKASALLERWEVKP